MGSLRYFGNPRDKKNFWDKNKTFIAIIIGALIIGGTIYVSKGSSDLNKINQNKIDENLGDLNVQLSGNCQQIPDLPDGAIKLVTKIIDGDTFLVDGGY